MCGIAGIISTIPRTENNLRLRKGVQCLQHRGPEGEGFYQNREGTVHLGHRRLCIIDLSEQAAQPFCYHNRYRLVHNGEIYNYIELREELKKKGFVFQTASDTEVVVAAYAAYGKDCVQHFDGAFAFAIWDEAEQTLFAARDRLGEKPFYFFYDDSRLVFASELKALWEMSVLREVNSSMLYNFISYNYTTNPADPFETFYRQVQKLPAAYTLNYHLPTQTLSTEQYWQVYVEEKKNFTEEAAIETFLDLLHTSIKRRLRSDVPIGTSLSGGLDSASIVALCQKAGGGNYTHKCFTGVFDGFAKDESRHAAEVAKTFGLQQFTTTIKSEEVIALMQVVMAQQDEPIASGSPLIQYRVYQLAKQHSVTVLLDGQGADEILGGYHKYYPWYWQELYQRRQLSASGELSAARRLGVTAPFSAAQKLAALFPHLAASLWQSKKAKTAFQHPDWNRDWAFAHKQSSYYSLPATPDLNGALYFSTFVQGLEELLRLADNNSMAHGLEVRLPFLSHELVAFLFTLPAHFKIREGWTKWILRKAVAPILPSSVVWRKDKVGFEPPQRQWMEQPAVQQAIQEAKELLVQNNILDASVLRKKNQPHDAHAADNRLWKYWSVSMLLNR
jgi:asparagine synthase (glutamine-hydrolysing)